ncbi:MAG: hypothetical protein FWC92_06635 [Defluviitaleaceae bacterium]|nr:hypothetical protein [Defluviitaleaceae bacterium]
MLKKCSKLLAMLVVLVMVLSTVVMANPNHNLGTVGEVDPYDPDTASLRKTLRMPAGTDTPEADFEFYFVLDYVRGSLSGTRVPCASLPGTCAVVDCPGHFPNLRLVNPGDAEPYVDDVDISFPGAPVNVPAEPCGDVACVGLPECEDCIPAYTRYSYNVVEAPPAGERHVWLETGIPIDASRFPHAGMFGFEVRERHFTNHTLCTGCAADALLAGDAWEFDDECEDCDGIDAYSTRDHLSYSTAVFRMYVHVGTHRCVTEACANPCVDHVSSCDNPCDDCDGPCPSPCPPLCDDPCLLIGNRVIRYVTFFRDVNEDETREPAPLKVAGMEFVNRYVRTVDPPEGPGPYDPSDASSLYISNTVTGDGNPNHPYEFTIAITTPPLLPDAPTTFRAYLMMNGVVVTPQPYNFLDSAGNANGVVFVPQDPGADPNSYMDHLVLDLNATFFLRHGQSLHFVEVPIGSTFNLTVTNIEDYTQTAIVQQGNVVGNEDNSNIAANVTNSPATNTDNVTVTGGLVSNITVNTNAVRVTHNYELQAPMGVFLNNLPFVGLIALAGVALTGFVTLKVRKAKEEIVYQ